MAKDSVLPADTAASAVEKKEYKDTNIQIRLPSGDVIRHSFAATDKLKDVRKWLKNANPDLASFTLLQPFPHKVMTKKDMKISLAAHGLVPSGTLMVTNSTAQKKKSCFNPLLRCFGRRT